MSISKTSVTASADSTAKATSSRPRKDEDLIRELDACVERICKAIPEEPYYLSVPCDHPYQHRSREDAIAWRRGTTFDSDDDEEMQYSTFIYRDHSDDILVCKSRLDIERERREKEEKYRKANGISAPSTPSLTSTVPKKKISLSAYKSKHANGLAAKNGQKPVVQGTQEAKPAAEAPNPSIPAEPHGQKRPLEEAPPTQNSTQSNNTDSQPPVKKQKSSPPPPTASTVKPQPEKGPTPHGLPPLLSPAKITNVHDLPPLLSPTLPPAIEKELKKIGNRSASSSVSAPSSTEKQKSQPSSASKSSVASSKSASKENSTPTVSPKGLGIIFKDHKPRIQSRSADTLQYITPADKTSSSTAPVTKSQAAVGDKSSRGLPAAEPKSVKPAARADQALSLVVKLKYGRKNRKEVERYLRLPPTRVSGAKKTVAGETLRDKERSKDNQTVAAEKLKEKERPKDIQSLERERSRGIQSQEKERSKNIRPTEQDSVRKGSIDNLNRSKESRNSTASGSQASRIVSGKRPRVDEEAQSSQPPAKRHKAPNALELNKNPRTPVQPAQPSPAASSSRSSALKSHLLTPKNNVRAAAMKRTESNESLGTTPKGLATTPVTSGRSEQGRKATSAPLSGPAGQWYANASQLNAAAYKLKHAAQEILAGRNADSDKRGAVMSLETVLYYMLAFSARDYSSRLQGHGPDPKLWRTLLPLWLWAERSVREFPHLKGLCAHLGVVIRMHIFSAESQRAVNDNSPDQAATATVAPDMLSGQTQALAVEAARKLPVQTLIQQYPKTWKGQADPGQITLAPEHLTPGSYKGPYFLPLSIYSTPLHAVRMGCVFLEEWLTLGNVKYKLQLKL